MTARKITDKPSQYRAPYSEEDDATIRELFPHASDKEIGLALGRSVGAISQRRSIMGLERPTYAAALGREKPNRKVPVTIEFDPMFVDLMRRRADGVPLADHLKRLMFRGWNVKLEELAA